MSVNDDQTFVFDVFNNTNYTLFFRITGNFFLTGAFGSWTVAPNAWLSAQNNNAPFPLTLNDNATGSLNFSVQVVSNGTPSGPIGGYTLEFDGTALTNFPGMAFYGSAGDIESALKTSTAAGVGYIFPLLYMNMLYNGSPVAVLMMVDALGASPDLATPYTTG